MLKLLGSFGDFSFASSSAKPPEKALLIVVLLTLTYRNAVPRRKIASILWEDASTSSASANMRQLLAQIRKWNSSSAQPIFQFNREHVFRDETCVATDLDQFLAFGEIQTASELSRLLSTYGSGLLPDLAKEYGKDLTLQLSALRSQMRERFVRIALKAAQCIGGAEGELTLLRLQEEEPYDETILRALIVHLAQTERSTQIPQLYIEHSARLHEELGITPEIETNSLVAQLVPSLVPSLVAPAAIDFATKLEHPLESTQSISSHNTIPRLLILPPVTEPYPFKLAQKQLALSLIEDVTISLCRIRNFAVIAPYTARQLVFQDAFAAAKRQNADYVISSRLIPASGVKNGPTRLMFSLIHIQSGEIILGDEIEFEKNRLAQEQGMLVRAVATSISTRIGRMELAGQYTSVLPSAYVNYLLGMEQLRSMELQNVRRARKFFARAIELSPQFSSALSMTARSLTWEWVLLGRGHREQDHLQEAQRLARQAIEMDTFDPHGHRELGHSYLYLGGIECSLEHFQNARDRAPHHADVLADQADALVHNSNIEKASELIEKALSLNPLPPDEYLWISGTVQFFSGNFSEALTIGESMKQTAPAARFLAACAAMAGSTQKMHRYTRIAKARYPEFTISQWRSLIPMRDEHHNNLYTRALKLAGFE